MTHPHAGRDDLALSFGKEAATYDRARPRYPQEAVDAAIPASAVDVVDVGAGTGILTRALLTPERVVTAIDPDSAMLQQFSRSLPEVTAKVGTAEQLPLPDASADAIVFGQSWHWVDVPAASAEAARVLRPGGTIGLIWNIRDEGTPWVRELSDLIGRTGAELLIFGDGPQAAAPFGPLSLSEFRWTRELTVDELVDNVASRSTMITATDDRRQEVLAQVRSLATQRADTDGVHLTMPYVTYVFTAATPA
ncbi:class I SAM-dependent methyltransferase [Jongsikchunia kroppenstedtii]|uniref:class I SAM-dependent methyltransferase n=1 Tax=Jongsikchunia kroppenstedtii TaxID=1121721 RepID=UPI00035F4F7B|nr:class I SAM-dependent methyltransferase [Jongsikchunia kroppenstedtii]